MDGDCDITGKIDNISWLITTCTFSLQQLLHIEKKMVYYPVIFPTFFYNNQISVSKGKCFLRYNFFFFTG